MKNEWLSLLRNSRIAILQSFEIGLETVYPKQSQKKKKTFEILKKFAETLSVSETAHVRLSTKNVRLRIYGSE
jgi:Sec7-like guanine-nucleotide exchange factor